MNYLILCDKTITIANIVELLGIKPTSIWFGYFINKFANNCERIDNFGQLTKVFNFLTSTLIEKFNSFNLNGDYFTENIVYVFDSSEFTNVNFENIKLRKLKLISFDRLLQ